MPGGELGATGRPRGTAEHRKGDAEKKEEPQETWQDATCFRRQGEGNAFMDNSMRSLQR